MSPVTAPSHQDLSKNYQDLAPLSSRHLDFLLPAFALGESDPRWSLGPGADNALRLQRSLEIVATQWKLPLASLSVIPDRYMAFYMAIMGVLSASKKRSLAYSPIEKKEILAIIDGIDPSIKRIEYRVGIDGIFDFSELSAAIDPDDSIKIVQLRNGETGISQGELPEGDLILDATSALPGDLDALEFSRHDWIAIVLDATSWGGPRGVNFLAINPAKRWKNPFPTLDTIMPTFAANYALTLLAALTLEEFMGRDEAKFAAANAQVREIVARVGDVDIAGTDTRDRLSLSFLYAQSEELARELFSQGFLFDSGSACSASALEPSHVLARMGLLTHGNVRLRFRPENLEQAPRFAEALVDAVKRARQ